MKRIADITIEDIIACKNEARRKRARLSFGEKVRIVEAMRERPGKFNVIRERKKQVVIASLDIG